MKCYELKGERQARALVKVCKCWALLHVTGVLLNCKMVWFSDGIISLTIACWFTLACFPVAQQKHPGEVGAHTVLTPSVKDCTGWTVCLGLCPKLEIPTAGNVNPTDALSCGRGCACLLIAGNFVVHWVLMAAGNTITCALWFCLTYRLVKHIGYHLRLWTFHLPIMLTIEAVAARYAPCLFFICHLSLWFVDSVAVFSPA